MNNFDELELLNTKQSSDYDSNAQSWFERLTVQPSLAWKTAFNTMIVGMKADGNFSLLDRFWIFATEQQQHARVSVANPGSTNITEANAPTWTANQGYTGNGTTSYLDLNYTPSSQGVNYLLSNSAVMCYSRTSVAAGTVIETGGRDAADGLLLGTYFTGGFIRYRGNALAGVSSSATVADSTGMDAGYRTDATNVNFFRNGAVVGVPVANASTNRPPVSMYALGFNAAGTAANFSTKQLSCVAYGSGSINQATFYTRFQTFATTIGFNI